MRAQGLTLAIAAALSGCSGEIDPCAGVGPVCIGLHVSSDVAADEVFVNVVDPPLGARSTRDPSGGPLPFPIRFAVELPSTTAGPVALRLDGLLAGGVVASASRTVTLAPPGYGSADVTLAAVGSPGADLAGADFAGADFAGLAGVDLAGADFAPLPPDLLPPPPDFATPPDLAGMVTITVTTAGTGRGWVQLTGSSSTTSPYTAVVPAGSSVTVGATPGPTSTFSGFSAPCGGTSPCVLITTSNTNLTATFAASSFQLYTDVISIGGMTGTVSTGLASCGTGCTSVPSGQTVAITATPTGSAAFLGWGGACRGTVGGTCTLANVNDDLGVTASFGPSTVNRAFVSSKTMITSQFGIIGNADSECGGFAMNAGYPNSTSYKAWMSAGTTDANTRFGSATNWVRPDGLPVALNVGQLGSSALWFPVALDELMAPSNVEVWTGTLANGTHSGNDCTAWSSTSSGVTATVGTPNITGNAWTATTTAGCNTANAFFCFGTAGTAAASTFTVTPTPRLAFLSAGTFLPGGGIGVADGMCASEATAAGFAGTFKALLATGAVPLDRFSLGGPPWARRDGTLVSASPTGTITRGQTLGPLNQHADASYAPTIGTSAWLGSGQGNCGNWSSNNGFAVAPQVVSPIDPGSGTANCQFGQPVFCLQQ
jgi:hypothetical protein